MMQEKTQAPLALTLNSSNLPAMPKLASAGSSGVHSEEPATLRSRRPAEDPDFCVLVLEVLWGFRGHVLGVWGY